MTANQRRREMARYWWSKATDSLASARREFIKTGHLDVKWGRLYDQLFEDRQEGDYVVFVSFEQEYVQLRLAQRTQFLADLQKLLSSEDGPE